MAHKCIINPGDIGVFVYPNESQPESLTGAPPLPLRRICHAGRACEGCAAGCRCRDLLPARAGAMSSPFSAVQGQKVDGNDMYNVGPSYGL